MNLIAPVRAPVVYNIKGWMPDFSELSGNIVVLVKLQKDIPCSQMIFLSPACLIVMIIIFIYSLCDLYVEIKRFTSQLICGIKWFII